MIIYYSTTRYNVYYLAPKWAKRSKNSRLWWKKKTSVFHKSIYIYMYTYITLLQYYNTVYKYILYKYHLGLRLRQNVQRILCVRNDLLYFPGHTCSIDGLSFSFVLNTYTAETPKSNIILCTTREITRGLYALCRFIRTILVTAQWRV